VLWHILCLPVTHKSIYAVLWHILCRPVLWHILCLPVAHKPKSLFVPCYGTFCAFPWHMVFCSRLSRIASQELQSKELQVKNCKSRIASQELQSSRIAIVKNCNRQELQSSRIAIVKNCKSRIASQELQKSLLDSLDIFFSRLNE
jgi:hypothetical protein